jgi:hypothetical protein
MQLVFPVSGHATGWSGHGLVDRVMVRRSQDGTLEVLLRRVVPEPVLARLVALDDRVLLGSGMVARMLGWRRVATADVAALRAAAQVEPPTAGGQALDAPRAAWRYLRIDPVLSRQSIFPFP